MFVNVEKSSHIIDFLLDLCQLSTEFLLFLVLLLQFYEVLADLDIQVE